MIPSDHRSWQLGLARWLAIGGAIAFFVSLQDCALAQIQADGTVGTTVNSSTFLPCNTSCTIEGGTQTGNNLFHSFGSFSIPNGGIADFLINNSALANILARVTGGSPSDIQGLIRGGGNANLFLINPNGIIFGPNAQLDIGGSFVGTTANAIGLTNGHVFSANPVEPLPTGLLNVNPNTFLFNQIAAQPLNSIEVKGNLAVLENRNLLLVGGNVFPDATSTGGILIDGGTLTAPGGRVELSSIAEKTEKVGLNVDGNNLSLNFPNNVARADVTLTNDADVNVRAQGGGSIVVNAQNLSLLQGSELLAGIAPGADAANSKAGDIEINAEQAVTLGRGSSIENTVQPKAQGEAGDIKIRAGSLRATEGAFLTTSVLGQGTAGNVTINAKTVAFDGDAGGSPDFKASGVYSRVESKTPSQGGSIAIATSSLSVTNGAVVATSSLSVTNGAVVTTSTGGTGNGGIVKIVADQVSFDGKGNFNGTFRQSSVHSVR